MNKTDLWLLVIGFAVIVFILGKELRHKETSYTDEENRVWQEMMDSRDRAY